MNNPGGPNTAEGKAIVSMNAPARPPRRRPRHPRRRERVRMGELPRGGPRFARTAGRRRERARVPDRRADVAYTPRPPCGAKLHRHGAASHRHYRVSKGHVGCSGKEASHRSRYATDHAKTDDPRFIPGTATARVSRPSTPAGGGAAAEPHPLRGPPEPADRSDPA